MSLICWITLSPSPCCTNPCAQLVHRRRAGEANIDQRAALEIDAVIEAALVNPGGRADEQQGQGEAKKILGLAHPIEINVVVKKLHPDTSPFS